MQIASPLKDLNFMTLNKPKTESKNKIFNAQITYPSQNLKRKGNYIIRRKKNKNLPSKQESMAKTAE